MPAHTSPPSSAVAYETFMNPDVLEAIGEAITELGHVRYTIAHGIINDLDENETALNVVHQLSDVPKLSSALSGLAEAIHSLQGELLRIISYIEQLDDDLRSEVRDAIRTGRSRGGHRITSGRGLTGTDTISNILLAVIDEFQEFQTEAHALNERLQQILAQANSLTASALGILRKAQEEYHAIVQGEISYFGSIMEGAAVGIFVVFYDNSTYLYSASRMGDGHLKK